MSCTRHTKLAITVLWGLVGALAVLGPSGWGADGSGAGEPGASYAIRPGDTLRVTTQGEPTYTGLFKVGPDGTIDLRDEMVGGVEVKGLTVQEAQTRLSERIARYVRDPVVTVEVARFKVLVTGAVRAPGQYEVEAGALVMEAITRAAGSNGVGDLERVYLRREGGEVKELNLRSFVEGGDDSQNLPLKPGDSVAVGYLDPAAAEGEYRVSGAVGQGGKFKLQGKREIEVRDALALAGGLAAEADAKNAQLIRANGDTQTVDLSDLTERPHSVAGIVLRAGDELFVPRLPISVEVIGAVTRPGRYRVAEGTTFLNAVAVAGGFSAGAILRDACVVRQGQPPVRIPANLDKTLKDGDMTQNPLVQDGDVLFVPSPDPRAGSRNPLEILGVSLYSLLYLLR